MSIFDSLQAVYLLLGPSCNMTCRHCSQTPIKNTFALKPDDKLSEDIIVFLQEWIKVRGNKITRIYFWGGEPLLYWETIQKYILLFESIGITPSCFRLYTNGLLLNKEIAAFCNAHRVSVTMSYDAPDPLAVRNAVPSQENIEALLACDRRSVSFVFNALNDDPVAAFTMLEELFPKTLIEMGCITVFHPMPEDIYQFKNNNAVKKAINALADEIIAGRDPYGNRYGFFLPKFFLEDLFLPDRFQKYRWPPCAPGLISLSLQFNGNIILCHNDNRVIAHITDPPEEIMRKHSEEWKRLMPENCLACPALSVCRNRCPIGLYTKDGKEYIHCSTSMRQIFLSIMENRERITEGREQPVFDLREEAIKMQKERHEKH